MTMRVPIHPATQGERYSSPFTRRGDDSQFHPVGVAPAPRPLPIAQPLSSAVPSQGTTSFPSRWDDHLNAGTVDRCAVIVSRELIQQEAHLGLDDSLVRLFPIRENLNRLAQIKLL